ncbi:cytochrome ubiquinol oxidase subunit I [Pseudoroseomonas ludipueritiae]|uniref:Cytochrome ubiquinol oxidase subunit I n=1 Tax=Pseudoroseomonas ludipueritiae TaxID=198093 RepID=A0ABR7R452_9PROT|nr:cytochrome ubiquinol oxidase subunit I [Pseudoroseomonas ludipueritiae]MBC9176524.1 cytochrome ubiquinol oxidase subunit I [Pseudoroseomonas ludipueritiae]
MTSLNALTPARLQFGATVSLRILYPAITIGLAGYLPMLEGVWLWKRKPVCR